jgi:hypothetical protein
MNWTIRDPQGVLTIHGYFQSEHEAKNHIRTMIKRFEMYKTMSARGTRIGGKTFQELTKETEAARRLVAVLEK